MNERSPLGFLTSCHRQYGDIFRLPIGSGFTIVADPDLLQTWLRDPKRTFEKGDSMRAALPALGEGLAMANGERWRRMRRALNPLFGGKSLDGLAPLVAQSLELSMERWDRIARTRETVDLAHELGLLTMRTFLQTMLSSAGRDPEVIALAELMETQSLYLRGLMTTWWAPGWLPVPGTRRGAPAAREIDRIIDATVAERRANPVDTRDLLNLLLELRHEDTGEPLSDAELRDELNSFLLGGFDTTQHALAWTIALLAENPECLEVVRAQADSYSGNFDSWAELDQMSYAGAAFREAQRIQGWGPLGMVATEESELAGYHIPKGSQVAFCDYLLGHDPRRWDDPERFDPERFLGDKFSELHTFHSVTFGGGRHRCIGFRFAFLQAQFALTMMAKRFHVQPAPGFAARHAFNYPIQLKGGLPVTLRLRSPAGRAQVASHL